MFVSDTICRRFQVVDMTQILRLADSATMQPRGLQNKGPESELCSQLRTGRNYQDSNTRYIKDNVLGAPSTNRLATFQGQVH